MINSINCIYCSNKSYSIIYSNIELTIIRCDQCGLVRQKDYGDSLAKTNRAFESIDEYYRTRSLRRDPVIQFEQNKIEKTTDIRHDILSHLDQDSLLLDVGCGYGEFLLALANDGLSVSGIEADPVRASFAREELGLDVITAIYDAGAFSQQTFDAISFIQVLEHVENPLVTLRTANKHLRPGGILIVEVPSYNNPRVLAYRLSRYRKLAEKDFIRSHNYYFTSKTLYSLANKAGFRRISVRTGRYAARYSHQHTTRWRLLNIIDWVANQLGVGGILLYAYR